VIENWVLIGDRVQIFYSVDDVGHFSVGAMHYLSPQIQNCLTAVALVQKVLHHFFLLLTEGADGGTYETSSFEIVPGEDAVLDYNP
jgi:hypothetical protein